MRQTRLLSVVCIRQKSYLTCALNSCCECTLMSCTSTRYTAGENFFSLGSILAELADIFIVYIVNLINTERANLFAAFSARATVLIVCHLKNLLNIM